MNGSDGTRTRDLRRDRSARTLAASRRQLPLLAICGAFAPLRLSLYVARCRRSVPRSFQRIAAGDRMLAHAFGALDDDDVEDAVNVETAA